MTAAGQSLKDLKSVLPLVGPRPCGSEEWLDLETPKDLSALPLVDQGHVDLKSDRHGSRLAEGWPPIIIYAVWLPSPLSY